MREVAFKGLPDGRLFTASLRETEDLVSPEAMGAYFGYGIRGVLTVACDVRPRCVAALPQLCLPVSESAPTFFAYFDWACAFGRQFAPLIVHCNAGVNRSRVFAAAIAHCVWGMGLEDAIRAADAPAGLVLDSMRDWALSNPRERIL
jgi:hypothetical protein